MAIYFTSEMVGKGHPDKLCDAIGDAILTEALKQDKNSRVAIETTGGKGYLFITGEITTKAILDYKQIARKSLRKNEYPKWRKIKIILNLGEQSNDINVGVSRENEIGAGDQGMMFGYATNETPNYLPFEFYWARELAMRIDDMALPLGYGSDFKTQVTSKAGVIDTIVVSIQHPETKPIELVREEIGRLVKLVVPNECRVLINPTGVFNKGWFDGDAGTTGRKIVVDSYGGKGRVGGGAFSGKDPTKVDRTGAYYARYVAKNIVANGLADKVEIQIAYAIGVVEPVSIDINTFGTEKIPLKELEERVKENFSFKVKDMIDELDLLNVDFTKYTNYSHFGHASASWEKIKKI